MLIEYGVVKSKLLEQLELGAVAERAVEACIYAVALAVVLLREVLVDALTIEGA